jgi:RecA-family ATPase
MVYGLSLAMASGNSFLGYKAAKPLNVLIVDNELHQEELAWRVGQVGRAMGAKPDGRLNFTFLRGSSVDIDGLDAKLDECGGSKYDIIVIDAMYRILPKGMSENDNASMTQIYNKLDGLARKNEAAIINIHHSSKGGQGDKGVTDVGAGAGAISRAADTHMVIREHVDAGLHVIDAVTRSGISPKPVTARLEWPLWKEVKGVEPTVKTFENAREKMNKEKKDNTEESEDKVINYMLKWQQENEGQVLNSAQIHQEMKFDTWANSKTFKKHLKSMVEKGKLKELPKEVGSQCLRYLAL